MSLRLQHADVAIVDKVVLDLDVLHVKRTYEPDAGDAGSRRLPAVERRVRDPHVFDVRGGDLRQLDADPASVSDSLEVRANVQAIEEAIGRVDRTASTRLVHVDADSG